MNILLLVGAVFFTVGAIISIAFLTSGMPLVAGLLPLIFVVIGGIMLYFSIRKMQKNKQLRENGKKLYAEIVEMVPNYNYTINGRHTYILRCEANFVPYECNYPKTSAGDLVGKRITVYVNPEKPEEYFVDLKSIT